MSAPDIRPASTDPQQLRHNTALTVTEPPAAEHSQRHHHHHHGHQRPAAHPLFSLGTAHPSSFHGAYPGQYPDSSAYGGDGQVFRRRRSYRDEPLYSLGKPLPTFDELRAARRLKQHHAEHLQSRSRKSLRGSGAVAGQLPGTGSSPELRTNLSPFPSIAGQSLGLSRTTSPAEAREPYILATPEMLRALVAEARRNPDVDGAALAGGPSDGSVADVRKDYAVDEKDKDGTVVKDPAKYEREDSLSSSSSDDSEEIEFPNPWTRFRHFIREPAAEFLGTAFLIMCGNGVNCQVTLSQSTSVAMTPKGDYLSITFGWATGVLLGIYVAGGISGGHLNPAVTLTLACYREFPWRKVPGYWFGQVFGAWVASVLIQSIYTEAINLYEGGTGVRTVLGTNATAALFYTAPLPYMSNVNCFFSEFMDTAFLLIVILAIGDRNNVPPPDGMSPFVVFWVVWALGGCLGMQTAYAVNPARDLGPRLQAAVFGYGVEVWDFRSQYWLWTPIIAVCTGGLFGGLVYDALIYTGGESWVNKPWRSPIRFGRGSKPKMPAQPPGVEDPSTAA